jgi:hypothetical protein
MSSRDDRTPNGRQLRRRRLREITERTIAMPESLPPSDWEDNEEPSVTKFVEHADGRVSVEGEADDVAKVLEAARRAKHPVLTRVQESMAPISKKMNTPGGKAAAIATGIVTVIGVLLEVLRQLGVFKAGP